MSRNDRRALQFRDTKHAGHKMSVVKLLIPALVYKRRNIYIVWTILPSTYLPRVPTSSRASYFSQLDIEYIKILIKGSRYRLNFQRLDIKSGCALQRKVLLNEIQFIV